MKIAKNTLLALLAMFFFAAFAQRAAATTINLSTGQNGSGVIQTSGGLADALWTVTGATGESGTHPAETVFPNDADFGINPAGGTCGVGTNWLCNDSSSDWIAFNPLSSANGNGTYSTTFDLSSLVLSTAILSGSWTVDDAGTLSVNGHTISTLTSGDPWTSLHSFTVPNADLLPGVNTITMQITSSDNFLEGVRLNGSVTGTATPEPGLLGLLGLGMAAIVMRHRLTKKS